LSLNSTAGSSGDGSCLVEGEGIDLRESWMAQGKLLECGGGISSNSSFFLLDQYPRTMKVDSTCVIRLHAHSI
jgi:hypothetical protein